MNNVLRPGETYQGHDRLYVPRVGHTTGDLDVHDIAVDGEGEVVFVATHFGCLAALSERHSFRPLWRPPFLSKLVAEGRCHLNGLALESGRVRYVTAVSTSDVIDGWRDRRRDGGCVVEVPGGQTVVSGLSMPHSPRTYRGELWLLNSGTGSFGKVDRARGLQVIDLAGGNVVEWARLEGMVSELYDIAVLPGVVRPTAFGFKTREIEKALTIDDR